MIRKSSSITSLNQRLFWLAQQQASSNGAYNVCLGFLFRGAFSKTAFESALKDTIANHAILRSTYELSNGELRQSEQNEPLLLEILEDALPGNTSKDSEIAEAKRILADHASKPFDLKTGPIIRLGWVSLPKSQTVAASITIHHIATDLHTKELIGKEISQRYQCKTSGVPFVAPPESPSYTDYAEWQNAWLESPAAEKALAHWRESLANSQWALPLPSAHPHDSKQTFAGGDIPFHFEPELETALTEFASEQNLAPFLVLLAVYNTLLARYSHCYDFVIGVPLSNRREESFENTVGCLMQVAPIAPRLEPSDTFLGAIRKIRRCMLLAHRYQGIPLERIVQVFPESRQPGRNPVFQVGFTREEPMALQLEAVEVESFHCHNGGAQLDLFLRYWSSPNGLTCRFDYNSRLFSESAVRRMTENFKTLLSAALEKPNTPIDQLELLSKEERKAIGAFSRGEETAFDDPGSINSDTLHGFLEKRSLVSPEEEAIAFDGQSLSYRQFEAKANQLAHRLIELGIKPESLVGVSLKRSINLPLALYGILKAGGAYVPVDPDYPVERQAFMLKDSEVPILITEGPLKERLKTKSLHLLDIDEENLDQQADTVPEVSVNGGNLAYMIYTSGSTGEPKGSLINHNSIVNRLRWMQQTYEIGPGDSILQKTPYSFDVSVWELFWPLATGARLVLAKPQGHRDPDYLVSLIQRERITIVHFVPSMLQAFLDADGLERCDSLRHVISSGEALPAELVTKFYQRLPGSVRLHNLYGPTEAAVDVTSWECPPKDEHRFIPIGKPIANTQTYVLDSRMKPVPIGVSGELYLGGSQIGRGYWRRQQLSSERFIDDPFSSSSSAKLFKTADIARFLPNGNLEYIGRADTQIKHRGFRIEPGEIENVMVRFPGIECGVVAQRNIRPQEPSLIGYIIESHANSNDFAQLRQYLRSHLPDYMVPDHLVAIDQLPISSNGKIDRDALPLPAPVEINQSDATVPTTSTEKALATLWEELLEIKSVGIRNNFFDIGGHSILVIRMKSMIKETIGVDLPIVSIFKYSTIESLADHISSQRPVNPLSDRSAQEKAQRKRNAFAQRRRHERH